MLREEKVMIFMIVEGDKMIFSPDFLYWSLEAWGVILGCHEPGQAYLKENQVWGIILHSGPIAA